jgi:hypothetical protein
VREVSVKELDLICVGVNQCNLAKFRAVFDEAFWDWLILWDVGAGVCFDVEDACVAHMTEFQSIIRVPCTIEEQWVFVDVEDLVELMLVVEGFCVGLPSAQDVIGEDFWVMVLFFDEEFVG